MLEFITYRIWAYGPIIDVIVRNENKFIIVFKVTKENLMKDIETKN